MPNSSYRSTLRIDLSQLAHNIGVYREIVGTNVKVMAVVKGNAYGHGSISIAKAALSASADWLGVASVDEGLILRQADITAPILVLGPWKVEEIDLAIQFELDLMVSHLKQLQQLETRARQIGRIVGVHVSIDTGLGREGVWFSDFNEKWIRDLEERKWLHWKGIMSHFSESDNTSIQFTKLQLDRFFSVMQFVQRRLVHPILFHLANSVATKRFPNSHLDMIRVGSGIYGVGPFLPIGVFPILTWTSQIVDIRNVTSGTYVGYGRKYRTIRKAKLCTVPVGYFDGYKRALAGGDVLIKGQRYRIAGTISMNQMTVLTPCNRTVSIGDKVTLIGIEDGEQIRVDDLSSRLGTIPEEVLTGIGDHVPRQYLTASTPLSCP